MAFVEITLVIAVFALLYQYLSKNFKFWEKQGVKSITPATIRGAIKGTFLGFPRELYTYAPEEPYVGIATLTDPGLSVRDPELIRLILTKDFNYFCDRGQIFNEKWDPLSAHLFFLDGKRWRVVRAKTTPAFTSGKLRKMFPLMQQVVSRLMNILSKHAEKQEAVDMYELLSRTIVDVILSCAFGLQGNSLEDPHDIYITLVRKNFQKNTYLRFIRALNVAFPWTVHVIPPTKDRREINDFFLKAFSATIKQREESGIKRNDFLDLLLEIKKNGHLEGGQTDQDSLDRTVEFSDALMASQAWIFFVAGSESSSAISSFAMVELANNINMQERLRKEVEESLKRYGEFTYESVMEMQYLDQFLSEILRLYTAAPPLRRIVTKQYTMPDGKVTLPVGVRIFIDTWGIHHDPKYYPDPLKFDPERFSPEEKRKRHKYTYLPFGEGPRICIGMRFALVEIKLILATIVAEFELQPKPGIPYPPTFSNKSVFLTLEHGAPVYLKKR